MVQNDPSKNSRRKIAFITLTLVVWDCRKHTLALRGEPHGGITIALQRDTVHIDSHDIKHVQCWSPRKPAGGIHCPGGEPGGGASPGLPADAAAHAV